VSFEAGAALALVGVTAWDTLVRACGLEPAETCLVHGGSGGVGHVAVQLAAAAGARVTTTASPTYHDRLAALGADTVLDYRRDDLEAAIADAGAPDVILDHMLDEYLGLDTRVAADGGRIAAIGNDALEACFPDVPQCRANSLTVHHVSMFSIDEYRPVLERLARLATAGDLEAVVAREYDLASVPEAQEAVVNESFLGKLVVTP
jgi:NADPH2:quinone reductase